MREFQLMRVKLFLDKSYQVALLLPVLTSSNYFTLGQYLPKGPCSNCAKTGKNCTFEWVLSNQASLRARRRSAAARSVSNVSTTSNSNPRADRGSSRSALDSSFHPQHIRTAVIATDSPGELPLRNIRQRTSTGSPVLIDSIESYPGQGTELLSGSDYLTLDQYTRQSVVTYAPTESSIEVDNSTSQWDSLFQLEDSGSTTVSDPPLSLSGRDPASESIDFSIQELLRQRRHKRKREQGLRKDLDNNQIAISHRLANLHSGNLLSDGLMRIYHDSMENALSCWLTERTCPYRLPKLPRVIGGEEHMVQEWGTNFSNRIFKRVLTLDSVSTPIRRRPLYGGEEQLASKALYLAIMAFATQWAQSSTRSNAAFPNNPEDARSPTGLKAVPGDTPMLKEFDRTIQESFWHQARQALQDAADVQSFRVVFAYLIFSLTQKPLNAEEYLESIGASAFPERHGTFQVLDEVITAEGSSTFLEQGLRHIHTMRAKLDQLEKSHDRPLLDANDRKTVDLLYWLGVMFDTLSAAMHQRPLVVSDEDSDNLSRTASSGSDDYEYSADPEALTKPSKIWDNHFFEQTQANQRLPLRWPCPYEEAAALLCDAAPIKVLLYRKVTRIQTLISRNMYHESLETAIQDALRVYGHWNFLYGPFINDCIINHDSLPARIQSWYICLTGHWHLAALLLADVIEWIDSRQLGLESCRSARISSDFVQKLRQSNSRAISDLARCSSPKEEPNYSHAQEFHFAVNAGALLTEPWTAVLTRSFAKAGALLLDEHVQTASQRGVFCDEARSPLLRCQDCIKGLWYLGKKSDVARLVSQLLREMLDQKATELQGAPPTDIQGPSWGEASAFDFGIGLGTSFSYDEGLSLGSFENPLTTENLVQ